jgi:peptidoglycan/xylan/chitin deacetylase (PgdA/CDA1 family)
MDDLESQPTDSQDADSQADAPTTPSQARRLTAARRRRRRGALARLGAAGSLIAVGVIIATIVLGSTGGSGAHKRKQIAPSRRGSTVRTVTKPGTAAVPILAYRVINAPPPQSGASPTLYVPAAEFTAQMNALKANGWHAVTLNQMRAYWTKGTSLGTGKPFVVTFDRGYASQFTNALPVLKRLGWVGVENLQVQGLSPADGGLSDAQIHGLVDAGWELDTEGVSQDDLTALGPTELSTEVTTARQTLQSRYSVPVNWFSYPSGSYNPTVVAAVRSAGFSGATGVLSGWARPTGDRYRLPRIVVAGGTSPTALLSQIASAQQHTATPDSYQGTPGT